jgi:hypothetical protein
MAKNISELVGAGLARDLIGEVDIFFVVHRSREGRDVGERIVIQTYPFRSRPRWRQMAFSLHDALAPFIVRSYTRTTETVQQVYLEFIDRNGPADIGMAGKWQVWCEL